MKNLKRYNDYINEELKVSTYKSAANKLKEKGHIKRSKELTDYSKNITKRIESVEIILGIDKYVLSVENIIVNNSHKDNINISIVGDKELLDKIYSNDYEHLWNDDKLRDDFCYQIGKDLSVFIDEGTKWEELDDNIKDQFYDFCEMKQGFIVNLDFYNYDDNWTLDSVTGTIIDDRIVANKLLKLLKNVGDLYGGYLEDAINTLKVNDLYTV